MLQPNYLLCTYDLKYYFYLLLGKYVQQMTRAFSLMAAGKAIHFLWLPKNFLNSSSSSALIVRTFLYIITSYLLKHAAPQIRSFSCKPLPRKGPFCFNAYSHLQLCAAASWLGSSVIADQIQFAISNLENFQVFLIAFCKHSFGY